MNKKILLPPEWHPQSALQIAWPDEKTDWKHTLRQVERLYVTLAAHIVKRQKLIIVCRNENNVKQQLQNLPKKLLTK
jgi:agmatine/peptidylarginine deiminase